MVHARPGRRIAGPALIAAGLALVGAAAWGLWNEGPAAVASVDPSAGQPPYRYELAAAPLASGAAGALGTLQQRGVALHSGAVYAVESGNRPVADFVVARTGQGPVLLDWQSHVEDPFLRLLPRSEDVANLGAVIGRHLPAGGTVLAWWDLSRQLSVFAGLASEFHGAVNAPLFVPASWRARRADVESIERAFWTDGSPAEAQTQRFDGFVAALLSDEATGIQRLRELAGGKPAVLVLHVRDLILLGQMAPERFGVAFRDFADLADVHGSVKRVHAWLDENKYPAYAVTRPGSGKGANAGPVRAIALMDDATAQTLAARLLPMMGNRQDDVPGATLVYQMGGFVVYEIAGSS